MRSPVTVARGAISVALLALAPAAIGACGGDDESGDTRPLVTFAKSGGAGGKAYSLVVDRGGGATLTTYPPKVKTFKLGDDKRDELVGLLDGIERLKHSYEPATPSADDFRYSVTYRGTTVQASDNAKLPSDLRSLIGLLDGAVDDET